MKSLLTLLVLAFIATPSRADGPRMVAPGYYEVPRSWAANLTRAQRMAAVAWARSNGVRWRIVRR